MRDLVIALHCSGSSARQWRALAQQLAPLAEFVAVDLHGHGARRPWPQQGPLTLAAEAALLQPWLQQAVHKGQRVHLLGHSYGGAVALKCASQHHGAIQSVAVYEPALLGLLFDAAPSGAEGLRALELAAAMERDHGRGDDAAAAARFADYWSGPGAWAGMQAQRQAGLAGHVGAVLAQFGALFHEDTLVGALPALPQRTLVLTGSASVAAAQRIGRRLRVLMPRARHETLAGLAHLAPLAPPAPLMQRLLDFLHEGGVPRTPAPCSLRAASVTATPAAASSLTHRAHAQPLLETIA